MRPHTMMTAFVFLAALLTSAIAQAQVHPDVDEATPHREQHGVHYVIAQYAAALASVMEPEERRVLASIDAANTSRAPSEPLLYLALDRGMRSFAPLALEGVHRSNAATRLRQLPSVHDANSAENASQSAVVRTVLRHREATAVASAEQLARSMLARGRLPSFREGSNDEREHAAARAVTDAADALSERSVARVAYVLNDASLAMGGDAHRARLVNEGLRLLQDMIAAARGLPAYVPPPTQRITECVDPFADDQPAAATPSPRRRGRRVRVQNTAPTITPIPIWCVDDLRCFNLQ